VSLLHTDRPITSRLGAANNLENNEKMIDNLLGGPSNSSVDLFQRKLKAEQTEIDQRQRWKEDNWRTNRIVHLGDADSEK
jgi:hypothetical protein